MFTVFIAIIGKTENYEKIILITENCKKITYISNTSSSIQLKVLLFWNQCLLKDKCLESTLDGY